MNHMAKKTVIAHNADFAKMPVTFLDSIFRQFRVNIFSNVYVFHPLLNFVGSFLNHPVYNSHTKADSQKEDRLTETNWQTDKQTDTSTKRQTPIEQGKIRKIDIWMKTEGRLVLQTTCKIDRLGT